jgi:uncharacterized protein YbjT (DUF2867 family)
MKIVIFGATGMVGRGVLLESLDSESVASVLVVGRRPVGLEHPKLREILHDDFTDFSALAEELTGFDACFWCIGVPSSGMTEARYTLMTYEYTLAAARVLHARNPAMRFCFVSGAGANDTDKRSSMWARVKGKTENALREVGFKEVVVFRPAFIRALRGSKPRGLLYRMLYLLLGLFLPIFRLLGLATTTVEVGRAMVAAGQGRATKVLLHTRDIVALASKT